MNVNKFIFVFLLILISTKLHSAIVDQIDWIPSPDGTASEKTVSSSVAALVNSSQIEQKGNGQILATGQTLKEIGFCNGEKLQDSLSLSFCNSTLVAPDIVLTAAHCLDGLNCQKDINFLFDFTNVTSTSKTEIKKANLFHCKQVLYSSHPANGGDDFAIIKLDRQVEGRVPVAWRRSSEIAQNDALFSIATPMGTSQVIARGKVIEAEDSDGKILSDYDAVQRQSGSPVFSSSGTLEGIHQGAFGRDVIVFQGSPNCYKWHSVTKDRAANARFTSVSVMLEKLNQFASPNPEAGEGDDMDETQN